MDGAPQAWQQHFTLPQAVDVNRKSSQILRKNQLQDAHSAVRMVSKIQNNSTMCNIIKPQTAALTYMCTQCSHLPRGHWSRAAVFSIGRQRFRKLRLQLLPQLLQGALLYCTVHWPDRTKASFEYHLVASDVNIYEDVDAFIKRREDNINTSESLHQASFRSQCKCRHLTGASE